MSGERGDVTGPATTIGWAAPKDSAGPETISDAPTRPSIPLELERDQRIGDRYVVRAMLGRGGMGAVYRATDEKLGVDVALKLVGDELAGRLRDEVRLAQKIAHPNVCRTYDLEEVDGLYFVKMEYLEGETLAARLVREPKLPVADVVRIARGVAAGLSAAHAQGIVHRDLKPGNIMLAGDRVVLMDFGIAKHVLSMMSTMAGTFGYMAPEQFANTRVDHRADLYALGCLVYEMLAGELVFGAANPVELATRTVMMPAPDVRKKRPDTPRWLAQATTGLLAKDPAKRDPGLAKLNAGPQSRASALALPLAVLVIAGGVVAYVAWSRTAAATACRGTEQRLAGVWDAEAKQAVQKAYADTKLPYAARAFESVSHALDGYTREWTRAVTGSCEATRVRGEQTEDVLTLRQACFDRELEEVRAVVAILETADAALVAKGDQVTAGLEPLTRCADIAALRAPDRPPTVPAAKEAEKAIAEAMAQTLAGRYVPADVAATKAARLGDELKYPPYKAQALRIRGQTLGLVGNTEEAAKACGEAVWLALQGRRDDIAVEAATCAATMTIMRNIGEARVWIGLAGTLDQRLGPDAFREARLLEAQSQVAASSGDTATAVALQEKQIAAAERAYGDNKLALAVLYEALGETQARNGAFAKAKPRFERALELVEQTLGTSHPVASLVLTNLGASYSQTGEADKARAAYDRALQILAQNEGENSPNLAMTLNNMADAATKAGDPRGALTYLDRAKAIAEKTLGEGNPLSHAILATRAEALAATGSLPAARTQFDEAVALEAKYSSPYLAPTLTLRGNLELHDKQYAAALAFYNRAVTAAEAQGPDVPDLWQPLAGRGRAQLALGKPADARASLERALTIAEKAQVSAKDLAPLRQALDEAR